MKVVKKLVSRKLNEAVNFKNKGQRLKLYNRTFMKHNLESRLFTLQQAAIDLSSKSGFFALDQTAQNFDNFIEAIGDIKTTIEIAELSMPALLEASAARRFKKLQNLKDRTDKDDLQKEELAQKPNEEPAELSKPIPKKKTFIERLMFWRK